MWFRSHDFSPAFLKLTRRNKVSFIWRGPARRLGMFRLIHFPLFSLAVPAHNVLLNACLAQHERGRAERRKKNKGRPFLFRNSRIEGNTFTALLPSPPHLPDFAGRDPIFTYWPVGYCGATKKKSPSHTDIQLKRQGKVDVFYVAQEQCKNFLLKNLLQKHFIPQTKNNYRYTYTQKNPILHNPSPPSGMQIRENNVKNEREGDKRRFNCNKSVGRRRLIRHWPLGQRIFFHLGWERVEFHLFPNISC